MQLHTTDSQNVSAQRQHDNNKAPHVLQDSGTLKFNLFKPCRKGVLKIFNAMVTQTVLTSAMFDYNN